MYWNLMNIYRLSPKEDNYWVHCNTKLIGKVQWELEPDLQAQLHVKNGQTEGNILQLKCPFPEQAPRSLC